MAAESGDVATLARKLRAKGQSDAQVVEGLRGLGFSKSQAEQAVADIGPTASAPTRPPAKKAPAGRKAAGGNPSATATPTAAPSGGTPRIDVQAPDLSKITLTPPRKINGGDLGGFLAGLVLYALALNFIRYGPAGVKGWLAAKFINRPADLTELRTSGSARPTPQDTDTAVPTATRIVGLTSTRPAAPGPVQ